MIRKEKEKNTISSKTSETYTKHIPLSVIIILFILLFITLLYAGKLESQCLEVCRDKMPTCKGGDIYENIPEQNSEKDWRLYSPDRNDHKVV